MTGLTDPMDEFYDRHPELVDLDKALETAKAGLEKQQALLAEMAALAPRRPVEDWLAFAEANVEPGRVFMLVDVGGGGYELAVLGVVDAYAVDPEGGDLR